MKGYRIKVVAQITINVTKEEFDEDDSVGIGFNKFNAVMYAKDALSNGYGITPMWGV